VFPGILLDIVAGHDGALTPHLQRSMAGAIMATREPANGQRTSLPTEPVIGFLEESMEAYSQRYDAALALAARAHRSQMRKGSDVPYIVHPVHVSVILLRHGFSEAVAIAGLLHDVVEDQNVPPSRIEAEFGPAVAEMVAALTEKKKEDGRPRPWEIRKQEALEQVQRASLDAVAVKAADALHSSRSMAADLRREGSSVWGSFSRGPAEFVWYYECVAEIVRQRLGPHPLAAELDAAVLDLRQAIAETGTR
jgi:(p)ppGpp synthase/HD superfamily hydrolase